MGLGTLAQAPSPSAPALGGSVPDHPRLLHVSVGRFSVLDEPPKKNPELIAKTKAALRQLARFELRYVKGHAGDPGNEAADALAREGVSTRGTHGWTKVR